MEDAIGRTATNNGNNNQANNDNGAALLFGQNPTLVKIGIAVVALIIIIGGTVGGILGSQGGDKIEDNDNFDNFTTYSPTTINSTGELTSNNYEIIETTATEADIVSTTSVPEKVSVTKKIKEQSTPSNQATTVESIMDQSTKKIEMTTTSKKPINETTPSSTVTTTSTTTEIPIIETTNSLPETFTSNLPSESEITAPSILSFTSINPKPIDLTTNNPEIFQTSRILIEETTNAVNNLQTTFLNNFFETTPMASKAVERTTEISLNEFETTAAASLSSSANLEFKIKQTTNAVLSPVNPTESTNLIVPEIPNFAGFQPPDLTLATTVATNLMMMTENEIITSANNIFETEAVDFTTLKGMIFEETQTTDVPYSYRPTKESEQTTQNFQDENEGNLQTTKPPIIQETSQYFDRKIIETSSNNYLTEEDLLSKYSKYLTGQTDSIESIDASDLLTSQQQEQQNNNQIITSKTPLETTENVFEYNDRLTSASSPIETTKFEMPNFETTQSPKPFQTLQQTATNEILLESTKSPNSIETTTDGLFLGSTTADPLTILEARLTTYDPMTVINKLDNMIETTRGSYFSTQMNEELVDKQKTTPPLYFSEMNQTRGELWSVANFVDEQTTFALNKAVENAVETTAATYFSTAAVEFSTDSLDQGVIQSTINPSSTDRDQAATTIGLYLSSSADLETTTDGLKILETSPSPLSIAETTVNPLKNADLWELPETETTGFFTTSVPKINMITEPLDLILKQSTLREKEDQQTSNKMIGSENTQETEDEFRSNGFSPTQINQISSSAILDKKLEFLPTGQSSSPIMATTAELLLPEDLILSTTPSPESILNTLETTKSSDISFFQPFEIPVGPDLLNNETDSFLPLIIETTSASLLDESEIKTTLPSLPFNLLPTNLIDTTQMTFPFEGASIESKLDESFQDNLFLVGTTPPSPDLMMSTVSSPLLPSLLIPTDDELLPTGLPPTGFPNDIAVTQNLNTLVENQSLKTLFENDQLNNFDMFPAPTLPFSGPINEPTSPEQFQIPDNINILFEALPTPNNLLAVSPSEFFADQGQEPTLPSLFLNTDNLILETSQTEIPNIPIIDNGPFFDPEIPSKLSTAIQALPTAPF